jgi:glycosyltransferase involved in cell wall biosynthesis
MSKVAHIITGLSTGGAEMALAKLLGAMNRQEFVPVVIALGETGPLAHRIRAMNIPVHELDIKPRLFDIFKIFSLSSLLRNEQVDVVQTWMPHANLIGGLAAFFAGRIPCVWSLHMSDLSPALNKKSTLRVIRLAGLLSGLLADKIVSVAESARRAHEQAGYNVSAMTVIPLGFDTDEFKPNKKAREKVRKEWGVADDSVVIGLVSRFDPHKDPENFILAAGVLGGAPDIRYVLCGAGMDTANAELMGWINKTKITKRFICLGYQTNMPEIYNGFDIATSVSCSEAFPSAVGEAMSSGLPCVVTHAGDSSQLLGGTGVVVPSKNPTALATAWRQMVNLEAESQVAMGKKSRERISDHFTLGMMASHYANLYHTLKA